MILQDDIDYYVNLQQKHNILLLIHLGMHFWCPVDVWYHICKWTVQFPVMTFVVFSLWSFMLIENCYIVVEMNWSHLDTYILMWRIISRRGERERERGFRCMLQYLFHVRISSPLLGWLASGEMMLQHLFHAELPPHPCCLDRILCSVAGWLAMISKTDKDLPVWVETLGFPRLK